MTEIKIESSVSYGSLSLELFQLENLKLTICEGRMSFAKEEDLKKLMTGKTKTIIQQLLRQIDGKEGFKEIVLQGNSIAIRAKGWKESDWEKAQEAAIKILTEAFKR